MSFPTTSVLDTFTRADADPIGAGWSIVFGNTNPLKIVSNQVASGSGANTFSTGYYTAQTYGPDAEVFLTIPTAPANTGELFILYLRVQSPNSGLENAYMLALSFGEHWGIYRCITTTTTQIGVDTISPYASGDSIGFSIVGTTLTAWYKAGAGSWTQVMSVTDTGISGPGYIGLLTQNSTVRVDNFGGGTVVATSPYNRAISLLGVGS